MNKFLESFFNFFFSTPTFKRATGAFRNQEDYRDIPLAGFQKPVGAPRNFDGIENVLNHLENLDQKKVSNCVESAIVQLFRAYVFRKTGKIINITPRLGYRLCKMFDGVPDLPGTFPRVGALVSVKYGFGNSNVLPENTDLSEAEYLDFTITEEMMRAMGEHKMPGFASVDINIEAIKEAIFQNGAVTGSTVVGKWTVLPLRSKPATGLHYTIWYKYEEQSNGDIRIYTYNSWGKGWLAWVKGWLFPGRGYFLWSEYKDKVYDILAFTDIPANYLEQVKKMPYKFLRELGIGMSGLDVMELQKMLNQHPDTAVTPLEGPGSPKEETSYFGPATKDAVIRWQKKNGVMPTGYFGPISIAKANERVPKKTLVEAIIEVESLGNDNAIGDKNLKDWAYGPMQIRQPCVDDVNRRLGTQYSAKECLGNRELSIKIFETYMLIYDLNVTDEHKARLWNGGPGWRMNPKLTDGYWQKVKAKMN